VARRRFAATANYRSAPNTSAGFPARKVCRWWANHRVHVAAEKAPILRVKVPSCQWPDSDTSRYHSPWWVTTRALRGVHGPAAQKT